MEDGDGAVRCSLAQSDTEQVNEMRDRKAENSIECKSVFLCPKCDRVYQIRKYTHYDKATKKQTYLYEEEYLIGFPKLQEKQLCQKCEKE
jgi:uncharacterized C2H2 Zn-finger protein